MSAMRIVFICFMLLSTARASTAPVRVVILGDSISDGYGLKRSEAYPALLSQLIKSPELIVSNASISGWTSAGGVRRLDWVLKAKPHIVVIELGANDGLRGQKLEVTENNLREMVTKAQSAKAKVLIVAMRLPSNYGKDYSEQFVKMYAAVAKSTGARLMPFLDEFFQHRDWFLPDGLHPNAKGHQMIAESILPHIKALLP